MTKKNAYHLYDFKDVKAYRFSYVPFKRVKHIAAETAFGIVKRAWIRTPGQPVGKPGLGRLSCPCGEAPETAFHPDTGDIACPCGITYTWDGHIVKGMETQLCTACNELVPQGCCTCGPRQQLQPLERPNKYSHLVGLAYPDKYGRTITVLDVDASGRALMERGGEYWGCGAGYLEDIKAKMEAASGCVLLDYIKVPNCEPKCDGCPAAIAASERHRQDSTEANWQAYCDILDKLEAIR